MGLFDGTSPAGLAGRADHALSRLDEVMDLILEALDTRVEQLCVTDVSSDPGLQKDFPVRGAQRWVIHRLAVGGVRELVAATPTDVVAPNVNRLGGTIVNQGATTVVLTLASAAADVAQEGLAEIVLTPNGSWDFRLGNILWCGTISAESLAGAGKITIAEV